MQPPPSLLLLHSLQRELNHPSPSLISKLPDITSLLCLAIMIVFDEYEAFRVLRELQGVMQRINAKQGLLVAWGGFTKDAIQEARNVFFSMRLWDEGILLNEIARYYEQFEDELKAELPLKRIWTLVKDLT